MEFLTGRSLHYGHGSALRGFGENNALQVTENGKKKVCCLF